MQQSKACQFVLLFVGHRAGHFDGHLSTSMSATMSNSMSAIFFVSHLVHLHVGHHVSCHFGHHNIVSTLYDVADRMEIRKYHEHMDGPTYLWTDRGRC